MTEANMNKHYVAAIDLGTNSCKAVIADEKGKYVYTDAFSVRMGEGMYKKQAFTEEAMQRGIKCFANLRKEMDKFGVEKYRAISTASCRMAKNAPEFIKQVEAESGIKIEVVDGFEEARINLKGALQHVCGKTPYVVLYDLGGGSTEVTLATNNKNPEILHTISIPWGARNASEAYNLEEYNAERAQLLHEEIAGYMQNFIKEAKLEQYQNDVCFVATSSTPLRFVSMIENFGSYDRNRADGVKVTCKDIDKQIASICRQTQPDMSENPYIGEKRSHIFVASCVIFKTIYDYLQAKEITASLRSAKDGMIEEMTNSDNQQKQLNYILTADKNRE